MIFNHNKTSLKLIVFWKMFDNKYSREPNQFEEVLFLIQNEPGHFVPKGP